VPPTDASLFDYSVSYGVPSLLMTVVCLLVLPLVHFRFARRRYARWPARAAVLGTVWMIAFAVAYGDVLWKAWHARQLCDAEAGVTVYRPVHVPGIDSRAGLLDWAARQVAEVEDFGVEDLQRWPYDDFGDGPSPRPAFVHHVVYRDTAFGLSRRTATLRRAQGGQPLAGTTGFRARHGWLDQPLGALPGPPSPYCRGPGLPGRRGQPSTREELILAAFTYGARP